jgi:hypothetical protein
VEPHESNLPSPLTVIMVVIYFKKLDGLIVPSHFLENCEWNVFCHATWRNTVVRAMQPTPKGCVAATTSDTKEAPRPGIAARVPFPNCEALEVCPMPCGHVPHVEVVFDDGVKGENQQCVSMGWCAAHVTLGR